MRTIRETLRRIGLPVGVVVIMLSMLGFLAGPTASAQTGYPPPSDQVASISGRVVDSVTGEPVLFGGVILYRCDIECFFVTSQGIGLDGAFSFIASPFAAPLTPGNYHVVIFASSYDQFQSDTFSANVGENVSLGDIVLVKPPVIGAISGNLVDAHTGQPVRLDGFFSAASLYRCTNGVCDNILVSQTTLNDRFEFASGPFSPVLRAGEYLVEVTVERYKRYRTEPFSVGVGEFKDLGTFALTPQPTIGSISGQVTDIATGGPVPGGVNPGAVVTLHVCTEFTCYLDVARQNADAFGRFHFDQDYFGRPLLAGEYIITITADQYNLTTTEKFIVGEDQHLDLGKVKILPYPVRFTDMRGCDNIPASGGLCQYSLRVTSGMTTTIDAASWSIVNVSSFFGTADFSTFQTDQAQNLRLKPGQSQVLNFKFRVPAAVPGGMMICTTAYISKDQSTRLFNTIGIRGLFCITKTSDTGGFRQMTDRERREHERQQRNGPGSRP